MGLFWIKFFVAEYKVPYQQYMSQMYLFYKGTN